MCLAWPTCLYMTEKIDKDEAKLSVCQSAPTPNIFEGVSFLCELHDQSVFYSPLPTFFNTIASSRPTLRLLPHTSEIFPPTAEIPAWTRSWVYLKDNGTWLIWSLRDDFELNLRRAKHFLRCGNKKGRWYKIRGVGGMRQSLISTFSFSRYTCTNLDLWAGALSRRNLIPHMPVFGRAP